MRIIEKHYWVFRNVIDVAALDSHNLQQHEYLERTKMYNSKVQQILSAHRHKLNRKPKCILEDIMNPEEVLNSEPIKREDLIMVIVCLFYIFNHMKGIYLHSRLCSRAFYTC